MSQGCGNCFSAGDHLQWQHGRSFTASTTRGYIGSGGNFRAGMLGAVGGAAFGAIGGTFAGGGLAATMERSSLEGFVGGALTEANGGRFSDGFLGAFAASAAGGQIDSRIMPHSESAGAIAARTAAAAALGGTASKINGGNFANGAWSAAFQHLFNDRLHHRASDPAVSKADSPNDQNSETWNLEKVKKSSLEPIR